MNLYTQYQIIQFDLLAYATKIAGDDSLGKDLLQEAYIKAMDKEHIFVLMNINQTKGWFYTTMKNKFIDHCRKYKKELLVDEEFSLMSEDFQNNRILWMTVMELPEHLRVVIILKFLHGYKSKEIAQLLTLNPSTVRNHISDGIKMIRKVYIGGQ